MMQDRQRHTAMSRCFCRKPRVLLARPALSTSFVNPGFGVHLEYRRSKKCVLQDMVETAFHDRVFWSVLLKYSSCCSHVELCQRKLAHFGKTEMQTLYMER